MFRRIDDFVTIWTEELKKTRGVLARVPASGLKSPGAPHRDLGRLGWHLLETCVELPSHLGLTVPGPKIANGFIATISPENSATARSLEITSRAKRSFLMSTPLLLCALEPSCGLAEEIIANNPSRPSRV